MNDGHFLVYESGNLVNKLKIQNHSFSPLCYFEIAFFSDTLFVLYSCSFFILLLLLSLYVLSHFSVHFPHHISCNFFCQCKTFLAPSPFSLSIYLLFFLIHVPYFTSNYIQLMHHSKPDLTEKQRKKRVNSIQRWKCRESVCVFCFFFICVIFLLGRYYSANTHKLLSSVLFSLYMVLWYDFIFFCVYVCLSQSFSYLLLLLLLKLAYLYTSLF